MFRPSNSLPRNVFAIVSNLKAWCILTNEKWVRKKKAKKWEMNIEQRTPNNEYIVLVDVLRPVKRTMLLIIIIECRCVFEWIPICLMPYYPFLLTVDFAQCSIFANIVIENVVYFSHLYWTNVSEGIRQYSVFSIQHSVFNIQYKHAERSLRTQNIIILKNKMCSVFGNCFARRSWNFGMSRNKRQTHTYLTIYLSVYLSLLIKISVNRARRSNIKR